LGVIDTLSAGFRLVFRKPWLLVIPLVLDLILFSAPKISVLPLFDEAASRIGQLESEAGATPSAGTVSAAEQLDALRSVVAEFNLASLLSVSRVAFPIVAGIRPVDAEKDRVISIRTAGDALGVALLLVAVGLFLACVYWGLLAQQARRERNDLVDLFHQVPAFWLRMVAVAGMLLALLLGASTIATFVIMLAQVIAMMGVGALSSLVSAVVLFGLGFAMLWLFFHIFFVPVSVTLTEAGPVAALQQSTQVVRTFLRPSLVLFVLVNLIATGLGYLWGLLMGTTTGTILAIVANAFVGSGLMAAVFLFYRDRLVALHQAQQMARSQA